MSIRIYNEDKIVAIDDGNDCIDDVREISPNEYLVNDGKLHWLITRENDRTDVEVLRENLGSSYSYPEEHFDEEKAKMKVAKMVIESLGLSGYEVVKKEKRIRSSKPILTIC